ncbi:MAG: ABC transporter permease [Solirubrobacteraceae bacterium]|jgi:ABC-2 type transport system permease protein
MPNNAAALWRQYRFERRLFWRNRSAAFFNFLLPLIFLALFGAIVSGHQNELDVIVPGIAGMSVMSTTFTALAYNLTFMREQGVLKRIRGTPLPSGVYLGGLALNAVTNTAIQIAIVVVAGRIFFNLGWPPQPLTLVVFVIAGVGAFALLGASLSYAIPSFEAAPAVVNSVFVPVILVSGVFFDVKHVPGFLRDIAQALPLEPLINGLTGGLVAGHGDINHHLTALAVIGFWALVGVVLAVRGFSWEARRA